MLAVAAPAIFCVLTVWSFEMNFDSAISFLSKSNWGFLTLWLVLLVIACAACFRENSAASTGGQRTNRSRS
jgi:hypothetical protein